MHTCTHIFFLLIKLSQQGKHCNPYHVIEAYMHVTQLQQYSTNSISPPSPNAVLHQPSYTLWNGQYQDRQDIERKHFTPVVILIQIWYMLHRHKSSFFDVSIMKTMAASITMLRQYITDRYRISIRMRSFD